MESMIPGDHKAGTDWAVSPNASSPGLLGWEPFFFFQLAIRPKASLPALGTDCYSQVPRPTMLCS